MTPGNEIDRRITLYLIARILIYNLLLGYFYFSSNADTVSRNAFFIMLVMSDVFFMISIIAQEYLTRHRVFLFVQFLIDIALITVLTFFDGGIISSNFSLIFYLIIIVSSVFFYDRGSIYIATIVSIAYLSSFFLISNGVLPVYSTSGEKLIIDNTHSTSYIAIFINLVLFYVACFMISNLSIAYYKKREQYEVQTVLINDIFENIPSLLLVFDRDGRLTLWNTKASEFFQSLYKGALWTVLLPEAVCRRVKSVIDEHVSIDCEERIDNHDFKIITAPILRNGETIGYLMSFEFITEKKRMERRINELDRMAYLGELGAGMAHELRNPLASLYGSIQVLNENTLAESDKELYNLILRESERLNKIVTDFLSFVRGVNIVHEDIDLSTMLSDIIVMIRIITPRRIKYSAQDDIVFNGDKNLLIQAFNNIIWNAVEATDEHGDVTVSISSTESDHVVTVRDTGKGIARDDIDHIFKPFYSRKQNGTGLGLAIAQKNIVANGGHIECVSDTQGTLFSVYLPRSIK